MTENDEVLGNEGKLLYPESCSTCSLEGSDYEDTYESFDRLINDSKHRMNRARSAAPNRNKSIRSLQAIREDSEEVSSHTSSSGSSSGSNS
jgi:hypothetical protein